MDIHYSGIATNECWNRGTKKIEVVVEIDMIPHRSFIRSDNNYYSIVY